MTHNSSASEPGCNATTSQPVPLLIDILTALMSGNYTSPVSITDIVGIVGIAVGYMSIHHLVKTIIIMNGMSIYRMERISPTNAVVIADIKASDVISRCAQVTRMLRSRDAVVDVRK